MMGWLVVNQRTFSSSSRPSQRAISRRRTDNHGHGGQQPRRWIAPGRSSIAGAWRRDWLATKREGDGSTPMRHANRSLQLGANGTKRARRSVVQSGQLSNRGRECRARTRARAQASSRSSVRRRSWGTPPLDHRAQTSSPLMRSPRGDSSLRSTPLLGGTVPLLVPPAPPTRPRRRTRGKDDANATWLASAVSAIASRRAAALACARARARSAGGATAASSESEFRGYVPSCCQGRRS